jgi:hypothetical protein
VVRESRRPHFPSSMGEALWARGKATTTSSVIFQTPVVQPRGSGERRIVVRLADCHWFFRQVRRPPISAREGCAPHLGNHYQTLNEPSDE